MGARYVEQRVGGTISNASASRGRDPKAVVDDGGNASRDGFYAREVGGETRGVLGCRTRRQYEDASPPRLLRARAELSLCDHVGLAISLKLFSLFSVVIKFVIFFIYARSYKLSLDSTKW